MATWTTLPDATLEPGKPIRSIDTLALRDNPVAIAEGEVGAPRIWGKAAKLINNYPILTVSAEDTYNAIPGTSYVVGTLSNSSNSLVVAATHTIAVFTGSMRFRASHLAVSLGTSALRIEKNGVLMSEWLNYSNSPESRVADVSIVPGDVIQWKHRIISGPGTSIVSGVNVFASNAYVVAPLYIPAV